MEEEDNQSPIYTYNDTSATGDILAGNDSIWVGTYSTEGKVEFNNDDLKDRMDRMEAKLDKIIDMLDYNIDSKTLHVLDELL